MNRFFALLACLSLVLFVGACGGDDETISPNPEKDSTPAAGEPAAADAAPEGFANAKCPMMQKPIDTNTEAAPWKDGKKVGFCCPGCLPKWNALSDEEKAAKLAQ
ncbi:MAG: hypothetical protein HRU14_07700 [Planctomycetes bacterium]|jgi:hypothetical protein|nr:hypothetical protein [Planctomycetota bacterium]